MTSPSSSFEVIDAGELPYRQAWAFQEELHAKVLAGGPSTLLLCSHPHVYSLGSQTKAEHLLVSRADYAKLGAEVVETNRGGDVTYHGPGQVIAYPIFRLKDFPCGEDLHKFLRALEEVLIQTLADLGLRASRKVGKTGVWIADRKIAAIGLRASRWVTMHGLALNHRTDLSYFTHIIPCGLSEGVTSLDAEGVELGRAQLQEQLLAAFARCFDAEITHRKLGKDDLKHHLKL